MLIDHIAWKWVPPQSFLGIVMHFVGRLTAPTMCFFLAEGFYYTRDRLKYGSRLFVFTLISWIPFHFFETGSLPFYGNGQFYFDPVHQIQSMIFTLFLSFLALCLLESNIFTPLKMVGIYLLCIVDMHADWHVVGILFTIVFYVTRRDKKYQVLFYAIIASGTVFYKMAKSYVENGTPLNALMQTGLLMFIPVILLYNGEKGSSHPVNKWFFYIFYPTHLVVLGLLRYFVFK